MRQRDFLNLGAGLDAAIDQGKKAAHFTQREAQIPRPYDEFQALNMPGIIASVILRCSRRLRHDTDGFIVSDCSRFPAPDPSASGASQQCYRYSQKTP